MICERLFLKLYTDSEKTYLKKMSYLVTKSARRSNVQFIVQTLAIVCRNDLAAWILIKSSRESKDNRRRWCSLFFSNMTLKSR